MNIKEHVRLTVAIDHAGRATAALMKPHLEFACRVLCTAALLLIAVKLVEMSKDLAAATANTWRLNDSMLRIRDIAHDVASSQKDSKNTSETE